MKPWVVLLVTLGYFYTAWDAGTHQNPWWWGFWGSYGIANICWLKATGVM